MEKCLFCTNQNDNSDEHIILNSLNGKLHSKEIICSVCNKFFGAELDKIGKEFFNPLLLILDFKNASGLKAENIEGEDNFIIKKGNKVHQIKPEIKEFNLGDKTLIHVRADRKNAVKYFESYSKKLEKEGKRLIAHKSEKVHDSSPSKIKVNFKPNFKFNLLLNKIALEFCQLHNIEFAEKDELASKVRALDGSICNVVYCNLDEEIRAYNSSEISHFIKLFSIENKLLAYIELLNTTCAIVVLSECFQSKGINHQYHQDALTGEKFSDNVVLNEDEIVNTLHSGGITDVSPLVDKLIERKRARDFLEEIDLAMCEIKDELSEAFDNNLITADEHDELLFDKSTKTIAELIMNNPYIIEESDDVNNDKLNYYHSNLREPDFDKFVEVNNHLIKMEVVVGEKGLHIVEKFEKIPIAKQKGIIIVRVVIVLNNGITRLYIPYREFNEGIKSIKME